MGFFDRFKKKAPEEEAVHAASSADAASSISETSAEDLVPLELPAATLAAYGALADALVDDAAARAQLEVWLEDPRAYYARPESDCSPDDVDCIDEDTPWFMLVDTLIDGSHQAVQIDWKAEVGDLVWVLNSIEQNPALHLEESDFPGIENAADCFDAVNALWNDKGWVLAYMDIDSDSYVLPVLTAERFEAAAPLAANVGQTLIKARNGL